MNAMGEESALAAMPRAVLNALPIPVLTLDEENGIRDANQAAESFFQSSAAMMARHSLDYFVPFGSPFLSLVDQVRESGAPVSEYRVDIGSPRIGPERLVDIYAAPLTEEPGNVAVMLLTRTVTEKIDRQLTHRSAARTVTGLAAMLAHEIKNPLSGIRGAAQLLESAVSDDDQKLTRLICDEADRIVGLVDKMEVFADERPVERTAVNIHRVLERVKSLAQNGFGSNVRIVEEYDPSLPEVFANRDQLIQVFLNLAKNAAEAVGSNPDGEIIFRTAFRPGIRLSMPGNKSKVSLPLEFSVIDNGPGVPEDMLPYLFDPFVTTKANGTGLGLALVSKIIGDHGGVIECESQPGRTMFRVLLPMHTGNAALKEEEEENE